jgi:hypothetical protein
MNNLAFSRKRGELKQIIVEQGSILENPAQIFTLLLVLHLLKQLSGSPSLIMSSNLLTLKAERDA